MATWQAVTVGYSPYLTASTFDPRVDHTKPSLTRHRARDLVGAAECWQMHGHASRRWDISSDWLLYHAVVFWFRFGREREFVALRPEIIVSVPCC